jgi:hypothetical protein
VNPNQCSFHGVGGQFYSDNTTETVLVVRQHDSGSTHLQDGTLDLIITPEDVTIEILRIFPPTHSDRSPIEFSIPPLHPYYYSYSDHICRWLS